MGSKLLTWWLRNTKTPLVKKWGGLIQVGDNGGLEEANQDDNESFNTAESNQIGEDRLDPMYDVNNAEANYHCTGVTMVLDNNGATAAAENEATTAASDPELPDSEAPAGFRLQRYPRWKCEPPAYLGWYHNPHVTKYGHFGVSDYWPYLAVQPSAPARFPGSSQFQMGQM